MDDSPAKRSRLEAGCRRAVHLVLEAIVSTFNRNPWSSEFLTLLPRPQDAYFNSDGLVTNRDHSFLDNADFQRAYQRAVRAGGVDYGIPWRVHVGLWAATTAERLEGAFVECGTGRGFMASAICEYLAWESRPFYLFDTFEPELVTPDGDRIPVYPPFYANGVEAVQANFREWRGVTLVVGKIPNSLENVEIDSVAFLHVDLNNPAPEEASVRHFWPRISPGGIILFDDYGGPRHRRSHVSADRVAVDLGFSILSLPTGQGLAIKPAA